MSAKGGGRSQQEHDHHANQSNPNNDAYQQNQDNHANQLNPNNEEYRGNDDNKK